MEKRLIELALEALQSRMTAIDAEIAEIHAQLESPTIPRPKAGGKRGPRSKAARKAQSARMKAYWAKWREEKAQAAANRGAPKKSKDKK